MKTYTFILIGLMGYISVAISQEDAVSNRNLKVEKNYNDEIYAVSPIFNFADILVNKSTSVPLVVDSLIGSPVYAPDIKIQVRPIPYSVYSLDEGHKGMIKFDKGTFNLWHMQGAYVYSRPNHFNIDVNLEYDNWKSQEIKDQFTRNIEARLGMNYYLTHNLQSRLAFHYDDQIYGLYGFQNAETESRDTSVRYATYGLEFGLSTFRANPSKWNALLDITFDQWKDKHLDNTESQLNLDANVSFRVSEVLQFSYLPQLSLSNSETYLNGRIWEHSITAIFDQPQWVAQVGLSSVQDQSKWHFWPVVDAHLNISKHHKFTLSSAQEFEFWGAQQMTSSNAYMDLESLVSFNQSQIDREHKLVSRSKQLKIAYTNTSIEDTEIKGSAHYGSVKNGINYLTGGRDALLQLENVDYQKLEIGLEANRKILNDWISGGMSVKYVGYFNPTSELLHRPSVFISPSIGVSLFEDKLSALVESNINNPQKVQNIAGEIINSSWRTNVNFSARFRLLDQLSIYANADNILNDDFEVWSGYNNFGRNLSGGVLLKF